MNNYYVYKHIRLDRDTGKPFYIGKGSGCRAYSKQHRNVYWHRIVKSGYKIEIILDNLTDEEAISKEIELIAYYRSLGFCEANFTDGGDGARGRKQTEKAKRTISEKNTGRVKSEEERKHSSDSRKGKPSGASGKKWSEEQRARLSEIRKLNPTIHTAETKRKIGITKIGKPRSKETKIKLSLASKGNKNRVGLKHSETKRKIRASIIAINLSAKGN